MTQRTMISHDITIVHDDKRTYVFFHKFHTSSVKWTESNPVDPTDGSKSDSIEAIKNAFGDNEDALKQYFDAKHVAVKMYYHNTRSNINRFSEEWQDNKDVENHELFQIWQSREELLPKEAASYYPKGHPKNPISDATQSSSLPVSNTTQSSSLPSKDLTVSPSEVKSSSIKEDSVSKSVPQVDDDSTTVSLLIDIVKDLF